ncbi:MAG: CapA family protein, partial [Mediterranea sp.]|nr:CapA family protein [Mediterranea sp.]
MLSCHPKRVGRWAWAVVLLLAACRPPEETTLSILFTGDVLLDRGVRQQIESRGVDSLFSSVSPLFHAMDATVVNLECPLTAHHTPIQKRYIFRAEPVWAKALARAGITHAALANNHSMDQGRSGLADTYQCLSNAGITPIGYGRNAAESA